MIESTNRTYTDTTFLFCRDIQVKGILKNRAIIVCLIFIKFHRRFPLAFKKGPFRNNRPKKKKKFKIKLWCGFDY